LETAENWEDLSSLVHWAANENIPLSIKGPAGVVAHSTIQRSQRRMFAAEVPIQHDIQVHVLLPEGSDQVRATIRRPEQDEETEVVISQEPSGMSSSISELRHYALLTIHW
jgi:hypothetical protein